MEEYENQLNSIKNSLDSDSTNREQTFPVRTILGWFGVSRRGAKISNKIRSELKKYELNYFYIKNINTFFRNTEFYPEFSLLNIYSQIFIF